jgi:hypothetical protein
MGAAAALHFCFLTNVGLFSLLSSRATGFQEALLLHYKTHERIYKEAEHPGHFALPSFSHFSFAEHSVPSESSSSSTDFGICPSSTYKSTWFLHSISTVKVFLAHNSFLLSSRSEENFFLLYFFFKSLVTSVATAR